MPRITMPQLGETVTAGTVTRWLKEVGEHVDADEPLLDVSTDKVDTEVPSAHAGVLTRILVAEGETVPIGTVLCVIGEEAAANGGSPDAHAASAEIATAGRGAIRAGLIGHQGWLRERPQIPEPAMPLRQAGSDVGAAPTDSHLTAATAPPVALPDLEVRERQPFGTARRRTAGHLRASLSTAAHTLTTAQVDYAAYDRVRGELSYLPAIAWATCRALREFPRMNASVGDDELVLWTPINLGIAVDLNHEGLVVPVIHDAADLRVAALAEAIRSRSTAARALALVADDFAGGTFTITNAGGYGTVVTGPVINTPQVGILSVDGIAPRPVAVPDRDGGGWAVAVRPVGNLSLSFDHRAVDGAYATAFVARIRDMIQDTDWAEELGR